MGKKNGLEPASVLGAAVREGRAVTAWGVLVLWEAALPPEVLVRLTLAESFPVHLSTRASGRSKDFNSSRLILLSCNNIDMLLFSIFIHPPAKKEQLPSGHS